MRFQSRALAGVAAFATILTTSGCSRGMMQEAAGDVMPMNRSASMMAASWSGKHAETANMLIQKYGEPQVVSDQALIWTNNGPFVRTVLWRSAVTHNFPMQHQDFLTQTVKFRVPPDKLDELWEYDGSVWAHRTRGELSAQCDVEPFNLLALNLAYDVAMGKRTAADARAMYAKTVMDYKSGNRSSPYTSGLIFQTQPNAADADRPHM